MAVDRPPDRTIALTPASRSRQVGWVEPGQSLLVVNGGDRPARYEVEVVMSEAREGDIQDGE